jgi:hypothetical protein
MTTKRAVLIAAAVEAVGIAAAIAAITLRS